ncbi:hypothetical protein TWF718_002205 [Orbilia javanica]|uniref:Uncharacterized protein n=1 Tax=Orbilia javanica TaxID=47235 RepID=A0AAN8MMZ9_9PEZI
MADSPYLHYPDAFWQTEWKVNGVWNGILSTYFPNGVGVDNWIVSPEVYSTWFNTNGVRADLCVLALGADDAELVLSDPILTYEGKGGNTQRNWQQIGQQIEAWCIDGVANYQPFCCWAVGTRGNAVTFYAFDGVNRQLHPLGVNAMGQIVKDNNVQPQVITTQAGWAFVDQILRAANNHPELTPAEIANDNF